MLPDVEGLEGLVGVAGAGGVLLVLVDDSQNPCDALADDLAAREKVDTGKESSQRLMMEHKRHNLAVRHLSPRGHQSAHRLRALLP